MRFDYAQLLRKSHLFVSEKLHINNLSIVQFRVQTNNVYELNTFVFKYKGQQDANSHYHDNDYQYQYDFVFPLVEARIRGLRYSTLFN